MKTSTIFLACYFFGMMLIVIGSPFWYVIAWCAVLGTVMSLAPRRGVTNGGKE